MTSVDPKTWGPIIWAKIHTDALFYPNSPSEDDVARQKRNLFATAESLPCESCRKHFMQYLNNSDLDEALSSRLAYVKFTFNAHNDVNKRLNKPLMAYGDFISMYCDMLGIDNPYGKKVERQISLSSLVYSRKDGTFSFLGAAVILLLLVLASIGLYTAAVWFSNHSESIFGVATTAATTSVKIPIKKYRIASQGKPIKINSSASFAA